MSKEEIIYYSLTLESGFAIQQGTLNVNKRGNFAWFNWAIKGTTVPSNVQVQLGTLSSDVRPWSYQSLICDSAKTILDLDTDGSVVLTRNTYVHPNAYAVGEVLWLRGMYPTN